MVLHLIIILSNSFNVSLQKGEEASSGNETKVSELNVGQG
jgi:hypothetical protein